MIRHRNATLPELAQLLDWAAEEGWNPGLDDADAFWAADPDGFFVAVDDTDTPVAGISVVNHNDSFAFLGLYLVRPERRGQGIGLGLWEHALQHAGSRTIGLDGVEAQQANYTKSGFTLAGGTTRYTGEIQGALAPDIRKAQADDIPRLIAQEAAASGVAKPAYLSAWFTNTAHRTTFLHETPAGITGFCTLRTCRAGPKIGPLVAMTPDIAEPLIRHAAAVADAPLTLDVPEASTRLGMLCKSFALSPGFRTARMNRGPSVLLRSQTYAVGTLELG